MREMSREEWWQFASDGTRTGKLGLVRANGAAIVTPVTMHPSAHGTDAENWPDASLGGMTESSVTPTVPSGSRSSSPILSSSLRFADGPARTTSFEPTEPAIVEPVSRTGSTRGAPIAAHSSASESLGR